MKNLLLGALGLAAVVVAIMVAPDVKRYIRISTM
jgi:hypothetical protein